MIGVEVKLKVYELENHPTRRQPNGKSADIQ
jgi:hypothetical protein